MGIIAHFLLCSDARKANVTGIPEPPESGKLKYLMVPLLFSQHYRHASLSVLLDNHAVGVFQPPFQRRKCLLISRPKSSFSNFIRSER